MLGPKIFRAVFDMGLYQLRQWVGTARDEFLPLPNTCLLVINPKSIVQNYSGMEASVIHEVHS